MSEITTIGLDLAKHVFQVHGIDAEGTTVLRKRLRRNQVLGFFSRLPRCVVGLEACATAQYWARELGALGHEVRLMPAQYVKAYVKRNKNDVADAEAICEAVQRPTMRFVAVKTAEQQAAQLLHRGREQLVRQRTMLVNALRAHLAEFGMVAAQGLRNVAQLIAIVRDASDLRLPDVARQVLQVLSAQLENIEAAIAALEKQLMAWHKANAVSQRLASIPGIGPIIATQPLFAPAAYQWGERESAAIEGDQGRSVGDWHSQAAAAAGCSRGAGEQDGVLLPLHRPHKLAACPDHQRLLRIDEGLHAERTADIGRDQAEHVLRDLEHCLGERVTHEMRTLRRRVESGATACRVEIGNGVARLHRVDNDAVVDEFERGNARGPRECRVGRLGVAHVIVPVEDDVAGNVVEKLRRTGADRILSLGYCWQRLVLDIDRFSGIPRSGQSFGYDQRDWLTDVPHLAECKHGTRRA